MSWQCRPIPAPLQTFVVEDNDMAPYYRPGFVAYFEPGGEIERQEHCVIDRGDGRRTVRFVTVQPDGLYTIETAAGRETDVSLPHVAPIRLVLYAR